MTKVLTLVLMILGFWSASLVAMPLETSLISKITLQKDNAKVAIYDNPFKQVVQQNFVNAISKKVDHEIAIKVFNQSQIWEALTGNASGTHLLRFSISATKFSTGTFTVKGAKNVSFYLNQMAIEGDDEFSVALLNQDYRTLLVVSGVEHWQDFSIQWLDDELEGNEETDKTLKTAMTDEPQPSKQLKT